MLLGVFGEVGLKGGSLHHFLRRWCGITNDKFVLPIVSVSFKVEFELPLLGGIHRRTTSLPHNHPDPSREKGN